MRPTGLDPNKNPIAEYLVSGQIRRWCACCLFNGSEARKETKKNRGAFYFMTIVEMAGSGPS